MSATIRLTTAEAIVRYLTVQRTVIDGRDEPLIPGVFAIFGHGNVTCLGPALHEARDELPTWRGQNEQGMALAAIAYAKAMRRRQLMVATTSIGPGALNLVTAAGVAMANRLPVLLLSGDTFQSRLPDPVLQQVEHFASPSTTANDAFRAVVRYWDRITRPEQVIQSLPQALAMMLDPAECGPAFIALPQDVQAEAYDYPAAPVRAGRPRDRPPTAGRRPGRRGDRRAAPGAPPADRRRGRGALLARRGRRWRRSPPPRDPRRRDGRRQVDADPRRSRATPDRSASSAPRAPTASPPRPMSCSPSAPASATSPPGSWSVFQNPDVRFVGINAARFDAHKHRSLPVVGDAREALPTSTPSSVDWRAPADVDGTDRHRGGYVVGATSTRPLDRDRRRRAADLRPGRARHLRPGHGARLRPDGVGRVPRRAEQRLAVARSDDVRLRVRVLVHGLRAVRWLGRGDGPLPDSRPTATRSCSSATART